MLTNFHSSLLLINHKVFGLGGERLTELLLRKLLFVSVSFTQKIKIMNLQDKLFLTKDVEGLRQQKVFGQGQW